MAFRQAAAVAPGQADAQRNLAIALSDHGDFEDALAPAQQLVALRPGDADAHRLAGRLLVRLARFDEARSHFERSLQIDPADADTREILRKLQAASVGSTTSFSFFARLQRLSSCSRFSASPRDSYASE